MAVDTKREEARMVADRYRRATLRLLQAAITVRDIGAEMVAQKTKPVLAATEDLNEAKAIVAALPATEPPTAKAPKRGVGDGNEERPAARDYP